jgi:hypothetical protein
VATYTIEHKFPRKDPMPIVTTIYLNEYLDDELQESIKKTLEVLPEPEADMFNALNHLRSKHSQEGRGNGEMTFGSHEVRISARTLLELLSGRLTFEEFVERYDSIPAGFRSASYTNFFDMRLKEGMLISEIHLEVSPTKDDDTIIIKLTGPDPAIAPFRVPKQ